MSKTFQTANGTVLPLKNLQGRDYLEVKYRLVWFREDHPTWRIETEAVSITDTGALFRAVIRDDQGNIRATAHKSETAQGFGDFIEKAETGSIGRALAHCGFGTQFAPELEEGERIVDSPAQAKKTQPASAPVARTGASNVKPLQPNRPFNNGDRVISEAQGMRLFAISKGKGMPDAEIRSLIAGYGYKSSKEIKMNDYEKIVAEVEAYKAPAFTDEQIPF